ncbi:MAG: class I SAM-dependent methyltransferase [Defluviitaleaceae bacterium]|nr:class I SAM-dependent methyltransferase [Defluviitaleaceae bacterium]
MNQNTLTQYWYAYIYDQQVMQDDVEHIIAMVGSSPLNILEVACGSGRISIPLAQKGHVVTGFDVDEAMLARIPKKAREHSNFNYFKADALIDGWGTGFDVVVLSGNVLVNIVTDGDYKQAQELFIKKASDAVKQNGYVYLDFTCMLGEPQPGGEEYTIFEGIDDFGTHGKFIMGSGGSYDSQTRIAHGTRRYEITPKDGEMFSITKEVVKHFPTHEQVVSWLVKYGFEVEWQNPISEETFHAIIWARKNDW